MNGRDLSNISESAAAEVLRMKSVLKRVWPAFFGGFYKPRDIQLKSCGLIYRGGNVLLASGTASGKTEAYLAPLTERWADYMQKGRLCILIVCPTRALANDLFKRIAEPLKRCRIKTLLRTGDHANSLRSSGAGAAVTTLESFDSLLCRCPEELVTLKALVLEELHVCEGTPRGDQLAVLSERLDALVHCEKAKRMEGTLGALNLPLQRLAVSATPGQPQVIVNKYLAGRAAVVNISRHIDFEAETVDYSREIDENAEALLDEQVRTALSKLRSCVNFCLKRKLMKMLVFVRSRAEAEAMAAAKIYLGVNPFGENIYTHHSSVSTVLREEREKLFAANQYCLCLATSTLEVGIDIGSVEAVAFTSPPADLDSFLQRIGRSGRRTEPASVLCLYADEFERKCYEHLLARVNSPHVFSEHPPFARSVLLQQLLSLTCQSPSHTVNGAVLRERLPEFLKERVTAEECAELAEALAAGDKDERGNSDLWLQPGKSGNKYLMGGRLQEAFLRGEIHHNISGVSIRGLKSGSFKEACLEVVEAGSLRSLGSVSGRSLTVGSHISLGGRAYRVAACGGGRAEVLPLQDKEGEIPVFSVQKAPDSGRLWAEDFAAFLELPPRKVLWTYLQYGENRYYIYSHFKGSVWALFFRAYLDCSGTAAFSLTRSSGFVLLVKADSFDSLDSHHPLELLDSYVKRCSLSGSMLERLASELELGPWSALLSRRQLSANIAEFEKYAGYNEESLQPFYEPMESVSGLWRELLIQAALPLLKRK
ncbi:DEAD/DEAH box helicase [bacterium]|nr:DEAD/DEAH box helicase [bacterium]